MNIIQTLKNIDLFNDFNENQIGEIASLCEEKKFRSGTTIAKKGEPGTEIYIVTQGEVDVILEQKLQSKVILTLGSGQVIGEMSLIDKGPRSATIKTKTEPTVVQAINCQSLLNLCNNNTELGYLLMRNLAADLSFKLRHHNLNHK